MIREVNAQGNGKLLVYDGAGNLVQKTDEEGNVTRYEYTAANRVESIRYGDGKAVTLLYNGAGQLVEMEDWNGKTCVERDPLQRVKSVKDAFGRQVGYAWDEVSNCIEVAYPEGMS